MSPEVTEDLRVMVTHLLLGQSPETHRTLLSSIVSPPFKRWAGKVQDWHDTTARDTRLEELVVLC